jgi:hypothetical protein
MEPPRSQATQGSLHAVSQHTASAQWEVPHCLAAVHAVPVASFGRQLPPVQKWVGRHIASEPHATSQAADRPEHRYGAQDGFPGDPSGTRLHFPRRPARSHASQGPSQAALQHTPSEQWVVSHWFPAAHGAPGFVFGIQLPPAQWWPGAQPPSAEQVLAQAGASPGQRYGAQGGRPGAPEGARLHVPREPFRSHASQGPSQE